VLRASGRTLILNDLIANLRRKDGIEGWILHAMGFGSDAPVTPTVTKLMLIKAKDELRRQLLEWAAISSASWFRMAIPSKPIRQACCGNWPGNCRRRTSPKTFDQSRGSQKPGSRVLVPRSTHLFSRARI